MLWPEESLGEKDQICSLVGGDSPHALLPLCEPASHRSTPGAEGNQSTAGPLQMVAGGVGRPL